MINEIKERIKAETPEFFKKLQKFGLYISTIGGIIIATNEIIILPVELVNISSYMVAIGFAITGTSTLPKKDV